MMDSVVTSEVESFCSVILSFFRLLLRRQSLSSAETPIYINNSERENASAVNGSAGNDGKKE